MREATIHLRDRGLGKLGFQRLVETLRQAGVREISRVGPRQIYRLTVETAIPACELDDIDTVGWWDTVDDSAAGATYVCELREPRLEGCPVSDGSATMELSGVRPDGFEISLVGTQADVSRLITKLDQAGVAVSLERLGDLSGSPSTLEHLTTRQQEVLRTAFTLGYYEVPRAATAGEIAAELDLEASTVNEHLRRAERNLLSGVLVPAD